MSILTDILIMVSSYSEGYRLMRARAYGYPYRPHRKGIDKKILRQDISDNAFRVALSKLKKRGFVENKTRGFWQITKSGREYLAQRNLILKRHSAPVSGARTKNMIVAFDIPEKDKKKREWLRKELVLLGFAGLQKSVWLGPSPLPEEFVENARELDILRHMKFFRAAEADIV